MTNELKKFKDILEKYSVYQTKQLIKNEKWGSLTFENSEEHIEKFLSMIKHLSNLPIEKIPNSVLNNILNKTQKVLIELSKIEKFTIEDSNNPTHTRNEINRAIKLAIDDFYQSAHIYIPYLAYEIGEVQNNIREFSKTVHKIKTELNDIEKFASDKSKQVEGIVKNTQEVSQKVGVAHFSSLFGKEAKINRQSANIWLGITSVLSISTVILAIYFLFNINTELETVSFVIQFTISKVVILGFLIASTIWSGNLYKALKHQEFINKFKENSLMTFQTFIESTDDENIKNAVLLETTKSIFSEPNSGYINNYSTKDDTKIIEIIKNSASIGSSASKIAKI